MTGIDDQPRTTAVAAWGIGAIGLIVLVIGWLLPIVEVGGAVVYRVLWLHREPGALESIWIRDLTPFAVIIALVVCLGIVYGGRERMRSIAAAIAIGIAGVVGLESITWLLTTYPEAAGPHVRRVGPGLSLVGAVLLIAGGIVAIRRVGRRRVALAPPGPGDTLEPRFEPPAEGPDA